SDEAMRIVSLVLMIFQLVSTPLTVTLKGTLLNSTPGIPTFPLVEPGAAVSPGTSSCNLANAPAVTVVSELVFVLLASLTSVAVTVCVPAVLNVSEKLVLNPVAPCAESAGRFAFVSLPVIRTVALVATVFQKASTAPADSVLNAVPAVRALGTPVLPETVPGAATSPGIRTCRRAYAPGATVTAELVLVPMPARLMSAAVTVLLPPVLRVTLNVPTPLTRGASAGRVALASEAVMWTESLVLRRFQAASTALTVTLNGVPAI